MKAKKEVYKRTFDSGNVKECMDTAFFELCVQPNASSKINTGAMLNGEPVKAVGLDKAIEHGEVYYHNFYQTMYHYSKAETIGMMTAVFTVKAFHAMAEGKGMDVLKMYNAFSAYDVNENNLEEFARDFYEKVFSTKKTKIILYEDGDVIVSLAKDIDSGVNDCYAQGVKRLVEESKFEDAAHAQESSEMFISVMETLIVQMAGAMQEVGKLKSEVSKKEDVEAEQEVEKMMREVNKRNFNNSNK